MDQISLVSDLFLAATRNARADVLLLQSSGQVVDLALYTKTPDCFFDRFEESLAESGLPLELSDMIAVNGCTFISLIRQDIDQMLVLSCMSESFSNFSTAACQILASSLGISSNQTSFVVSGGAEVPRLLRIVHSQLDSRYATGRLKDAKRRRALNPPRRIQRTV